MAAAGLCAVLDGTPARIENAAEVALDHHLGMTCDPVSGLVQLPCIERNGIGANKAAAAASLALRGDGTHFMPLDNCICAMWETGQAMSLRFAARGHRATLPDVEVISLDIALDIALAAVASIIGTMIAVGIALAGLIMRSTARTDRRMDRFEDAMAVHRTEMQRLAERQSHVEGRFDERTAAAD